MALVTGRASHYFQTPGAGGKVSKTRLTQIGWALKQLGIKPIAASSPPRPGAAAGAPSARSRTARRRSSRSPASPRPMHRGPDPRCIRPVPPRGLPARAQRPRFAVAPDDSATAFGPGRAVARHALHPGGAPGRQRQLRALAWVDLPDPGEPAATPRRACGRSRPRVSRRRRRSLLKGPQRLAPASRRSGLPEPGLGRVNAATRSACGSGDKAPPCPRAPRAPHQQRPHQALPNADIFTRSLQWAAALRLVR